MPHAKQSNASMCPTCSTRSANSTCEIVQFLLWLRTNENAIDNIRQFVGRVWSQHYVFISLIVMESDVRISVRRQTSHMRNTSLTEWCTKSAGKRSGVWERNNGIHVKYLRLERSWTWFESQPPLWRIVLFFVLNKNNCFVLRSTALFDRV